MKLFTTLLLSGCCLVASAQKKSHDNLHQAIHDDGKTMIVTIEGTSNGRTLNYNRTFNAQGMTPKQKDALVKHITDSLGVSKIVQLHTN